MKEKNRFDHWLEDFLGDDAKVKLIFDNARNFVVCSAVLYATTSLDMIVALFKARIIKVALGIIGLA